MIAEQVAAAARAAQQIADNGGDPSVDSAIRLAVGIELAALLGDVIPAVLGELAPPAVAAVVAQLDPLIDRYAQRIAAAVVGELAPVDVTADVVEIELP